VAEDPARRRPCGFGIPGPRAARCGHRRRQLRAYEEDPVGQDTLVREELFEGCRWPNDHHIAAGRSAIFAPVKARRSADGDAEDVSRQVRIGGDRKVGDRAVETIASTVISPFLIAYRAFAHVCSIIQSGERTASSLRWIRRSRYLCAVDDLAFADRSEATVVDRNNRLHDNETALESSPGSLVEWQQSGLPGHDRAARRPASRLWYTKPAGRRIWSTPTAIT
jgi:hypothetical protein